MRFVKMFSADWCVDCQNMLNFFEQNNIVYQVVNVDKDETAIDELKSICGGKRIVPTLDIEGKYFINPSIREVSEYINENANL